MNIIKSEKIGMTPNEKGAFNKVYGMVDRLYTEVTDPDLRKVLADIADSIDGLEKYIEVA